LTYYITEGYAGTVQSVATNATYCAGFIVYPGGLSVGHIAIDVTTDDASHPVDFGIYNSAGTLEAHTGPITISTTGTLSEAFTGGTQTIAAGKAYFCTTSTAATLAFNMRTQSPTFFSYATVSSATTSGTLNGTITPPSDSANASSSAIAPAFILLP
jgi:hypothetical protein